MPKTNQGGAGEAGAPFQLPADLSTHTVEQLDEILADANSRIDAILDAGKRAEDLPEMTKLAKAIKAVTARKDEIAAEIAQNEADFDALLADIRPTKSEVGAETPAAADETEVLEGEVVEQAPQLVTASAPRPKGGAVTASRDTGGLSGGGSVKLNPSLSSARAEAPKVMTTPQNEPLAITASVGLPGALEMGGRIENMRQLGDLVEGRAKTMPDAGGRGHRRVREVDSGNYHRVRATGKDHNEPYTGVQVASIRNDYGRDVFNETTGVDVVAEYIDRINGNRSVERMSALVAGGGWCAPSQIRYDFFNIAAQCGMIDLPTFGVERGGIAFPISPSLADTFSPALPWYTAFSSATVPWLWTEADDILTVTGSTNKPCIRVPCSTMDNRRLECYGICLTAGNLADNAWPESTRNFLQLLMAAHYHASNARYISTIAGLATGVTGCSVTGTGAAAPILNTFEMGAIDYRAKFGMCDTDVIEVVLPEWTLGFVRADLAKRTGVSDFMCVPNSAIRDWFDCRGIRAQFVQDYQVRAAGQPGAETAITQYPQQVKGLLYAAGTVARGNGMNLNLGVVRDSTLNAENDFTAAWLEECHLIARFGHEVREYTVNACPDGTTGAADLTSCC